MKSHNVTPHDYPNEPQYTQIYSTAESKIKGEKFPVPPKAIFEDELSPAQLWNVTKRNPIMPEANNKEPRFVYSPDLTAKKNLTIN